MDHRIGDILSKLMGELSQIADDIDQIPISGTTSMTMDQMVAYQKIDLSSQKLRDFSNILAYLSKDEALNQSADTKAMLDEVQLEYTTAMLQKQAS